MKGDEASRPHLLRRIGEVAISSYEQNRKAHPHRFIDAPDGLGPNFLYVENVANLLGCGLDHVRRIPRNELPASKIGQRLIYARADVESFIAAKRDAGESHHVPARSPAPLQHVAKSKSDTGLDQSDFNPVEHVRHLLGGVNDKGKK